MQGVLVWALSTTVSAYSANTSIHTEETETQTVRRIQLQELPVVSSSEKLGISAGAFSEFDFEKLKDYSVLYEPGFPEIPVIRFYVSGEVEVRVEQAKSVAAKSLGAPLKPSQPSRVKLAEKYTPFVMKREAYERDGYWPEKVYELEKAGRVDGKDRYLLTLYPIQYNAKTNQIRQRSGFEVIESKSLSEAADEEKVSTYAFVVGEEFWQSPELEDYAELKREKGFYIERLDVESTTHPDEIREWLQSLYHREDLNLEYVLIIGDAKDVAGHESNIISGITDHYYRALDSSEYMDDLNGPDVHVGRLAVQSQSQLRDVLLKLTRYQRGEFEDTSWLKNASFVATDDKYKVAEATHNYVIENQTKENNYQGFYPTPPMQGGDKLYAVAHKAGREDLSRQFSEGRSIINYSGHGATTYWLGPAFRQSDIKELAHPEARPFVISNACVTGDFRVSESFAETWIRHPEGAIFFWGSMDNTYWTEDDVLERSLYKHIFENKRLGFGEMTEAALADHWKHYGGKGKSRYYWETYVNFGDPEIRLRTQVPQAAGLRGPAQVRVGETSVDYYIEDEIGNPIEGVRLVGRLADGSLFAQAQSDTDGRVRINFEGATRTTGLAKLYVSGSNLVMAGWEIDIISADGSYAQLEKGELEEGGSLQLKAGESSELRVRIKNFGNEAVREGELKVVGLEGAASLNETLGKVISFGSLAVDEAKWLSLGQLEIEGEALENEKIRMKLELHDKASAHTTEAELRVLVTKPRLDLSVYEPQTSIEPGSRGEIELVFKNAGSALMSAGDYELLGGYCVTSVSGSKTLPELQPGEAYSVPVQVDVRENCSRGQKTSLSAQLLSGKLELSGKADFYLGGMRVFEHRETDLAMPVEDYETTSYVLDVEASGKIDAMELEVRVEHSYIGDLVISLESPAGETYVLRQREGISRDGVHDTYTSKEALADLRGTEIHGRWTLLVEDRGRRDEGSLEDVRFSFEGYFDLD